MAGREYVANEAELPRGTLVELFLEAVDRFGAAPAYRHRADGGWADLSYTAASERAFAVAGALGRAGLRRGDRIALLSENRPEWALADWGALLAGVQLVPVYATLSPEDVRYLLADSGSRAVVVSDREQLEKVLEIRDACPELETVVVLDPPAELPPEVRSWSDFLEDGRAAVAASSREELRGRAREAGPDDVATILYTSGTTGPPKGVMLTHDNIFSNVKACEELLPLGPDDRTLSILPLSHILQRMVDYLFFSRGCTIAYPRSRETVPEDMRSVAPTVMVAVPRVYEKVFNRVLEAEGLRGKLADWARRVALEWTRAKEDGRRPGTGLRLRHRLADLLVFRKIRAAVGGRIRFFVSGGGPLSPEINRFFHGAGLPILEGYGLTETSPVTNVNTEEELRIGSVGRPVPGTAIRISDDGEILVRGPQVMKGYFEMPEATAEALTDDGWLHTGDIGEIDDDGFLRITDRLKDIIITSGGKNIAPQPIENLLKNSRWVDQAVMVGDGRKFAAALVVPAFGPLEAWAREQGVEFGERHELLHDRRVQEFLRERIYGELESLSRYELPKKVGLLPEPLTVEGGALTPTEKVKRRVVEERYRDLIETFYTEEAVERTVFVAERKRSAGPRPEAA